MNQLKQIMTSMRQARAERIHSAAFLHALMILSETPAGLKMTVLADETGMTTAGSTNMVDTLEKAGLVQRMGDPLDRRINRVLLTQAGREAIARIFPQHNITTTV